MSYKLYVILYETVSHKFAFTAYDLHRDRPLVLELNENLFKIL